MLPLEKLRSVKTILTHASCSDGTASAILLRSILPETEVVFLQHGQKAFEELEPTEGMLFCDLVPPAQRLQEFIQAGTMVLDHHKKGQGIVEAFGPMGVFADEVLDPGVSGAVLAFREVWAPLVQDDPERFAAAQQFATRIGIRDTWQSSHPDWEVAQDLSTAIFSFNNDYWLDKTNVLFAPESKAFWDFCLDMGRQRRKREKRNIDRALQEAYRFTTPRGTRVVVFSGVSKTSEAVSALDLPDGNAEADLVVGFTQYVSYDSAEPQFVTIFSTRSHTSFDCGSFCAKFKGGGHTKAAGFSLKRPTTEPGPSPYIELVHCLEAYEREVSTSL